MRFFLGAALPLFAVTAACSRAANPPSPARGPVPAFTYPALSYPQSPLTSAPAAVQLPSLVVATRKTALQANAGSENARLAMLKSGVPVAVREHTGTRATVQV